MASKWADTTQVCKSRPPNGPIPYTSVQHWPSIGLIPLIASKWANTTQRCTRWANTLHRHIYTTPTGIDTQIHIITKNNIHTSNGNTIPQYRLATRPMQQCTCSYFKEKSHKKAMTSVLGTFPLNKTAPERLGRKGNH